ncbi:MAG: TlpA family protein disulfide reductase [Pedobacter sp.]
MKTALRYVLLSWILIVCITTPALCQLPAGDIAPDFKLQNIAGKTIRLKDFQGSLVVLAIGTTWCPGCKAQLSELSQIKQFLDDNRIPVVDVFVQEPAKTVRNYLKDKKLPTSFEALLDDGQVHRAYRVYPIPRLLILDRSGRIVQDTLGLDGAEITGILQKLVDQQPAPP